jgi:hypothetical protein
MRCSDCNKFVGLEFNEPEVESDLEVNEDGTVTASVRIVRACSECGNDLKEATFDLEFTPTQEQIKDHLNPPGRSRTGASNHETVHELEVEQEGIEQIEEGGGRYAKSYFGAEHLEESYHEALCNLGALGIEFALAHKERFMLPSG